VYYALLIFGIEFQDGFGHSGGNFAPWVVKSPDKGNYGDKRDKNKHQIAHNGPPHWPIFLYIG
jgi:hypothetical protein